MKKIIILVIMIVMMSGLASASREYTDLRSMDDDWYKVYAGAGDTLTVRIEYDYASPYADLDLEVWTMNFSNGAWNFSWQDVNFLQSINRTDLFGWPKGTLSFSWEIVEFNNESDYYYLPTGEETVLINGELLGISSTAGNEEIILSSLPITGYYYIYVYDKNEVGYTYYDLIVDVKPAINIPSTVEWNKLFTVTSTLTCDHPDGCGDVTATLDPKKSSSFIESIWSLIKRFFRGITGLVIFGEKGVIPVGSGTPFYTTGSNPQTGSCLLNMQHGDSCTVTWNVNATGSADIYEFFIDYESPTFSTRTTTANVTIIVLDSDNDGVLDNVDKCLETTPWYASEELRPNHYDSSKMDLTASYGCSCGQILYCKPGENNGEYKWGCTEGTMNVWTSQTGWSLDCQENGKVVKEGEAKPLLENTDSSDMIDILDGDNDNDGIPDSEDSEDDSAPVESGQQGKGKPDWWCDIHPDKC